MSNLSKNECLICKSKNIQNHKAQFTKFITDKIC